MEAIIVLSILTILCLIGSAVTESKSTHDALLITAVIFLFIIGSHIQFNPAFIN